MKCKNHPTYKGIRKPKQTNKFPKGCPECILIYKNILIQKSDEAWEDYILSEIKLTADN
jgi:hypothetical protein